MLNNFLLFFTILVIDLWASPRIATHCKDLPFMSEHWPKIIEKSVTFKNEWVILFERLPMQLKKIDREAVREKRFERRLVLYTDGYYREEWVQVEVEVIREVQKGIPTNCIIEVPKDGEGLHQAFIEYQWNDHKKQFRQEGLKIEYQLTRNSNGVKVDDISFMTYRCLPSRPEMCRSLLKPSEAS